MQIVIKKNEQKSVLVEEEGVLLTLQGKKLDDFIQGKFKQIEEHSMHFLPINELSEETNF